MSVMIAKNRGDVAREATYILHDTANASYVIAGDSATSNLSIANTQAVESAVITRFWYGTEPDAFWTVSRGDDVVAVLNGTGYMLLDGAAININPTANLSVNLSGGNGFIMTELKAVVQ